MAKNKTLQERWDNEVLSDNASLHPYEQCKTCALKDQTKVKGVDYGYKKGICEIYVYPENKPNEIMLNQQKCEFYAKAPG